MDPGIIVLIVAVVALVWGAVLFLRGGLLAGCLAVLLAGICFGHSFFNVPAGPIPLTADRALWLLLVIQYVLWRKLGRTDPKPLGKAEYVLLAFVGVLLASTLTHDWWADKALPASRLLFFYLMPVGLYWVARQAVVTQRALTATFVCLAVFGVYLAVTGIAETQEAWWMVFPPYILTSENTEFFGRARGPLLNPVGNGILMAACVGSALMCWPRAGRGGKLILAAAAILLAVSLAATLTRSVWIGAALGLLTVLVLVTPRRWLPAMGVGLALVALLGIAVPWDEFATFKRDRDLSAEATADSARLRPILAAVAWEMFRDRPLCGCGLGRYPVESVNYLSDRSGDLPLEKARSYVQHNVFLSLLTETGILGAGLFTVLLGSWVLDAWRLSLYRPAPLAVRQCGLVFLVLAVNYVVNGMFHDVSIIAMMHMTMFFMAGLTAGLWARANTERQFATMPGAETLATAC
jgi:O-antigen ligase